MEDSKRSRCNSLDTSSLFNKDVLSHGDFVTFDPKASEPLIGHEPTPAEVAQCEAEVSTLLSIIADLNKKMGSLKAPRVDSSSDPGDTRPPRPSRPLVPPDLLSHRLLRSSPESSSASAAASKHPATSQGGGGVVWTQLQEVLSSVEDSISFRRTWAAPITASDQNKDTEHLRAAQENWTKATQMLEEIERDFGISCSVGMPKEQHLDDFLDLEKHESVLRNNMPSHNDELQRAPSNIFSLEDEKNKVLHLAGLHKAWRSDRFSPSYRPPSGALSPDRPPPSYPGSPLLHRRTSRAATPLSLGGDGTPLGCVTPSSPCPSPISLESETDRLNRCIERLKARNERLTAALERRKADSEQISLKLCRLESDCSALQMALRYSEECEEAYGELLFLYEAKLQQCPPLQIHSAEPVCDMQQSAQNPEMGTEELSTSFCTAGVTEETQSHTRHRTPDPADREAILRQQIERLKRERAAICPAKPGPGAEVRLSSETGQAVGTRWGHMMKDNSKPPESKREKASLFYELISVREEMSDLRALIRLKEKELRCLEWGLMGQKSQEAAGVFIPENLRDEAEDRKTEQRFGENAAKPVNDGEITSSLTRPILKELQAVLQREQALKRRLAMVHDSLNSALANGAPHRKDNAEQIARLTQAHSKALSSYRQIRRKYREQVWRLEQKVAAMMESQHSQSEAAKAAEEGAEWRKEETIL
ncbi:colorectal mutant cancer protein isoform X1 [Poecilia formosa]|uniref:colorectal mutant cancer protein isoform X1 n=1 Tax=Poecilia formosa TaxID=48698 RepID=UPI000443E4A7|nr:PREDICTED: Usher syndrome type-1C protein-binding protein 1 isoform X1 [Poecilia formosa]